MVGKKQMRTYILLQTYFSTQKYILDYCLFRLLSLEGKFGQHFFMSQNMKRVYCNIKREVNNASRYGNGFKPILSAENYSTSRIKNIIFLVHGSNPSKPV